MLVTGAAGFIGSHLSESVIAEGGEVIGIDSFSDTYSRDIKQANLSNLLSSSRFRLVEGDINDLPLAELLDVDVVFHCAARAGVRTSWGREFEAYTRDNTLATQRLLDAAKGKRIRRFVYASSSSVYGNAAALPVDEAAPPAPISPYGVTKLTGEHLGHLYYVNHGVPFVALRLFTVYGPRQRPDMAFHRFFNAVIAGRPIEVFGDGRQSRDFTFVTDAVSAFLSAADADRVVGEVINVGSGIRIPLSSAVEALCAVAGGRMERIERPPSAGDAVHTFASIEKARMRLGYFPRTDLRSGLEREFRWLQSLTNQSTATG